MTKDHIVGASVPRKEGRDKVTGQARYIDDITLPGMLYGATVRSQIPRGRIKKITFGPGIAWNEFVIVSAKDIPGKNHIALITDDQPCLARVNSSTIRRSPFSCWPIRTATSCRRPWRRFPSNTIRFLPSSPSKRASAFGNHLGRGQYLQNLFNSEGRCGEIWEKADYIVEGEYFTGAQEQLYIENNGMIAAFDPERGRHGVGLTAVSLLRAQGADGAFQFARGQKFA